MAPHPCRLAVGPDDQHEAIAVANASCLLVAAATFVSSARRALSPIAVSMCLGVRRVLPQGFGASRYHSNSAYHHRYHRMQQDQPGEMRNALAPARATDKKEARQINDLSGFLGSSWTGPEAVLAKLERFESSNVSFRAYWSVRLPVGAYARTRGNALI